MATEELKFFLILKWKTQLLQQQDIYSKFMALNNQMLWFKVTKAFILLLCHLEVLLIKTI